MKLLVAALLLLPGTPLAPRPDGGDDQYQFVSGLQAKGMHELVVKEARAFLRDFPGHAKESLARYRLATSLFELGHSEDAAGELRRLARVAPFEYAAEVAFRLGQCELALDRPAAAAASFERVGELGSDYLALPAAFLAGEARFRADDLAGAERDYRRVLAAQPDEELARGAEQGLAWCAFRAGRHAEAASLARAWLARHRDGDGELHQLLGEAELKAGRPAEALAAFRAVPEGPRRGAALFGAGLACEALERPAEAAAAFAEVLAAEPAGELADDASLRLAIARVRTGDPAAALRALDARPAPSAERAYWRARAHAALADHAAALADLERAAALAPAPELAERIQAARGDALLALGRGGEAVAAFRTAASDYALHAAAVASFNEGRFEEAAESARALLERGARGEYADVARTTLGEALAALGLHAEAERELLAVADSDAAPELRSRALLRAGWSADRRGDAAAAARAFGRVADEHARSAEASEATFLLGTTLDALGDARGARRALERYLGLEPRGARAPAALLALGRLDGAGEERRLDELLRDFPDSAEAPHALHRRGELRAAAGDHDAARASFGELLRRFPGHALAPAARYGDAWSAHAQGDAAAALAALEPLRSAQDPALAAAASELGVFAADAAGDGRAAEGWWERLAALDPDPDRALELARVAAGALARGGEAARARALLDRLARAELDPVRAAAARVEESWIALDAGDLRGAEEAVGRALAAAPKDGRALEAAFFVGEARWERDEPALAEPLYRAAAAERSPVADRALYKQGFALLRAGDPGGAQRAFAELAERHRTSELFGEALYLASELRFRAGDVAAAAQGFERLLAEVPRHEAVPKALFRLGEALVRLGRPADAERALAELARRAPELEQRVEADLWRARALAAQGKERAARAVLAQVIAADEGVLAARARLDLGKLSLAAGDGEAALAEFLKVSLLYAGDEEVAEALLLAGQCLEAAGARERARAQYREILDEHPESSSAAEAARRLGERIPANGGDR